MNVAIRQGLLSAHDMRSEMRTIWLADQISALSRKLDYLGSAGDLHEQANTFELKYRQVSAQRFSVVSLPQLDSQRKVPIDSIYVAPKFQKASGTTPQDNLAYSQLTSSIHRTVLLGNPGAGKSTTAAKICADIARFYDERLVSNRCLTPVHVLLREYAIWRKDKRSSLVGFIEDRCSLQVPIIDHVFEYLLTQGRLLLVFDGLDELVDTRDRQIGRDDIEDLVLLSFIWVA
jgi:predicted NACHT family NTPase